MSAAIHTLSAVDRAPTLRVALLPGGGPSVEALVQAYLPAPVRLTVGAPGPDDDLAIVWWDGAVAVALPRLDVPLVALCAGGPAVLAAALDAGADHALALPVTADLLRAACAACVRRWASGAAAPAPEPDCAPPVLHLDRRAHTLVVHGCPVHLTLREFDLLGYLVANDGAACTRDEILEHVWGIDFETGTNTVDVFVYALRRKLRAAGLSDPIETVRGVGYRLAPGLA
ncbi:winged helix-turn-helix domain-containing protein [Rubrivirga sp. IMCC45206]|uniref:winged helix-turn-helix domain-containing protein n=1 Tax=Rubrivirga sp. IMCC45206 TaxID=3391614 RepID=UPI00398FCB09